MKVQGEEGKQVLAMEMPINALSGIKLVKFLVWHGVQKCQLGKN